MKKNVIRLTEGQLHNVIKESVKRILTEMYGETEYYWCVGPRSGSYADDSAEFEMSYTTPEQAYQAGLDRLVQIIETSKQDGTFPPEPLQLTVYYFDENDNAVEVDGLEAESNEWGEIE